MSLLAQLSVRVLGPVAVLIISGLLLAPAMGPVLVRLIRDAVRAVWPGEQRDARAAFGAILMGLLVGMSIAVLIDASLTFLGTGTRPPTPALGGMLASGNLLLARAPWLAIYPGIVLTALASSLILIGYGTLGLLRSRPAAVGMRAGEARQLAGA
jgi:peptide/nickel transport system permease protein